MQTELAVELYLMSEGKLFDTDEERMSLPTLVLENAGIDKAIRWGDPQIWGEAIGELGGSCDPQIRPGHIDR